MSIFGHNVFWYKRAIKNRLPHAFNIGIIFMALVSATTHVSVKAQGIGPGPSANCTAQQSSVPTTYQNITVPGNVANGTPVTDWFPLSSHQWKCNVNGGVMGGGSFSFITRATPSGFSDSSPSFGGSRVYHINNHLGYQVRWRVITTTATGGFASCNAGVSGINSSVNQEESRTVCSVGSPGGQTMSGTMTLYFDARMVKIGNIPSGTYGTVNFSLSNVRLHGTYTGVSSAQVTYQAAPPTTCNVSAQPSFLNLGSVTPPQIPFVNSSANPQPFNFVLQCTAGSGTPKYILESHPTPYTLTNNVLPNTANGAAYGVGIQIRNSAGTLLPWFNQNTDIPGWNGSFGGMYTIGLQARIIRTTQNQLNPGNIWSQMRLRVIYQ